MAYGLKIQRVFCVHKKEDSRVHIWQSFSLSFHLEDENVKINKNLKHTFLSVIMSNFIWFTINLKKSRTLKIREVERILSFITRFELIIWKWRAYMWEKENPMVNFFIVSPESMHVAKYLNQRVFKLQMTTLSNCFSESVWNG